MDFPMEVRYVKADEKVKADLNKAALQRGPIVYCFEWPDNNNVEVRHLMLNENAAATTQYDAQLLNGLTLVKTAAHTQEITADNKVVDKQATVTAIPYYAWANRGAGDMTVWVADKPGGFVPLKPATVASKSKVSGSHRTKTLKSINDQLEPANSHDASVPYYHWWPMKDTTQWVQYDFEKAATVSGVEVYWYDDSPWGGCRVPASWKVLYKDAQAQWKEVKAKTAYPAEKDKFNTLDFDAVQTSALRLEVRLPKEHASGIMEWKVKE
ncbi:discoidin domain-containing protein [Chitinophaga horti]|uniref:Discoidin domain-containing protein n=1 Tax=Chitinophaga horti TaxID=2920382 RepID=A0ABY6IXH1_9BACT|nr:discoidin domain-containing protein [Chitinophaga horti]UYQ91933.1 discoidin domain-containing protein [Chitinophaga horti]